MTRNFQASTLLRGLKDFQRATVEYVFARMFDENDPAMRFLVADEVGLGKTMIAKGVIAKTIDHLERTGERLDIVYVCSNAEIAAQNIKRLMLPGQSMIPHATRLTLLPLITDKLDSRRVNLISFTPGTTFGKKKGGGRRTGRKEERRLIYQMLRELDGVHDRGFRHALRGSAGDYWDTEAQIVIKYDKAIEQEYRERVAENSTLLAELREIAVVYSDRRMKISEINQARCMKLIGDLRALLARVCLVALKPALVILDEFQRFNELFDDPEAGENPAAELAHQLFNYEGRARVLLLSATPYKMFARDDEDEDHYADFLHTLRFLFPGDRETIAALKANISALRTGMLGTKNMAGLAKLDPVKNRIESALKRVMCRTERVEATQHADSMVVERPLTPQLSQRDLKDFRALEELADELKERETIEYWKSSPYLLNFMGQYAFKDAVREQTGSKTSGIHAAFSERNLALLEKRDINGYKAIDPGNARLRALIDRIDTEGLWKLLWMPPSMKYWGAGGEYKQIGSVSKHLVFSAWNVVPDALAALLSFEAERRIVSDIDRKLKYTEMPRRFGQQLRFSNSPDGRPAGMSALLLAFPSQALARIVDPLNLHDDGITVPTYAAAREHAMNLIGPALRPLVNSRVTDGPVDRRWYWVALARIEAVQHPEGRRWCSERWAEARLARHDDDADSSTGFDAHVRFWLDAWDNKIEELGRVPSDLIEVLADIALAAPATCALRTLSRIWPHGETPSEMLDAAARIAEGLRSQFNSPRAVAMLKAVEDEDSYWQSALQYGADGNLQALLDEYAHILFDSHGLGERSAAEGYETLAKAMFEAMSLRSATLRPDEIVVQDGRVSVAPLDTAIRTHFALRFGTQDEEEGAVARKESVQAAFNSPFWPFVLASTSIGQEGLDFHCWCHSVIHWNLPSNPVDMEQREGRVHRYKGYAVRKNVASCHGEAALRRASHGNLDLWNGLFNLAVENRPADSNDLIPYWIYETEGGARIERTVMALPLSCDEARYRRLKRSLALYRLVFAQPRQEDLLACLEQTMSENDAKREVARWRISLRPDSTPGTPRN
ncbi:helicase [Paraburkholderia edwinii]|uniref:Helicase n=1 Tax=Paraburkholderia edwinii TaxID=2861782 RepID=A0ABX8UPV3_9BURK|nr:helicase-related protein [Paraburkholderia edwinii]QYD69024.1 helicase [Paraburkholderia edwinii]